MLFELKNVDLEAMEMESKSSKYTFDTTVVYIWRFISWKRTFVNIFLPMNMKNTPSKVAYFRKIEELTAQTTQTVKIMFSNVAYRSTVYKTGGQVKKSGQL